ncbi:hypothetical protein PspLS_06492 [Pyricularia sp. CBS 133598]|nr:hypothetical protein PspLS_06492 [Pyricularia sp. CBS 133598]
MAPPTVRRAPYKDFLQPAFHRRFSSTATVILAIAYFESVLLAKWNSYLWTWFPVGPAGIRTFFIFLCGLFVLILRIAQYHVGIRISNSGLETVQQHALKLQTLEAVVSYVLSSWLFSQTYLGAVPSSANLDWITYFNGDRPRLNEKPIFFTVHFIILGIYQAVSHIYYDQDRLTLGVAKPRKEGKTPAVDTGSQLKKFGEQLPAIFRDSLSISLVTVVLSAVVYPIFLRSMVWGLALSIFRPFYSITHVNLVPPTLPFTFWLLLRCISSTFMLSLIWLSGNTAFSIFLTRDPIKNAKPLTSDSKDPNGSLLNGLKSKKLPVKCFAMWELGLIACDFDVRRKAIYEDIDRKDGPVWAQVFRVCLEVIKEMETNIDNYGKAPTPAPVIEANSSADLDARFSEEAQRGIQAPKNESIEIKSSKNPFRAEVEKYVDKLARDTSRASRLDDVGKAAGEAKQKLLEMRNQLAVSDDPQYPFQQHIRNILSSPVGWPLRQDFSRRLTAAVFGAPYGEPSLFVNATVALSQLAVRSLQEDKYGNVQRDVATIIRSLTSVTQKLDTFKNSLPFHWTDIQKHRSCPEVEIVLEALRDGLSELVLNFEPYRRDLRLSLTDMRLAREAIGVAETAVEPTPKAKRVAKPPAPEMQELR